MQSDRQDTKSVNQSTLMKSGSLQLQGIEKRFQVNFIKESVGRREIICMNFKTLRGWIYLAIGWATGISEGSAQPVSLKMERATDQEVLLSWLSDGSTYSLERSESLAPALWWSSFEVAPVAENGL